MSEPRQTRSKTRAQGKRTPAAKQSEVKDDEEVTVDDSVDRSSLSDAFVCLLKAAGSSSNPRMSGRTREWSAQKQKKLHADYTWAVEDAMKRLPDADTEMFVKALNSLALNQGTLERTRSVKRNLHVIFSDFPSLSFVIDSLFVVSAEYLESAYPRCNSMTLEGRDGSDKVLWALYVHEDENSTMEFSLNSKQLPALTLKQPFSICKELGVEDTEVTEEVAMKFVYALYSFFDGMLGGVYHTSKLEDITLPGYRLGF